MSSLPKPEITNVKNLTDRRREVSVKIPAEKGKKARSMKLQFDIPDPPMIRNEAGWGMTVDGRWESPVVEVDGEFVPRQEIWAVDESITEADVLAPLVEFEVQRILNTESATEQVMALTKDHVFTIDDITVSFTAKPQSFSDGWVEVYIHATGGDGQPLNVDDGSFRYFNPPEDWDVEEAVVETIRRLNEVS